MTQQDDGSWECVSVSHLLVNGWVPTSVVMSMFPQTIAKSLALWLPFIVARAAATDE